jgi:hypothetical protein
MATNNFNNVLKVVTLQSWPLNSKFSLVSFQFLFTYSYFVFLLQICTHREEILEFSTITICRIQVLLYSRDNIKYWKCLIMSLLIKALTCKSS